MASQTQSSLDVEEPCVMCNKGPAKRCGRCRSVFYCSQACQKSDYASHKLLCKAYSEQHSRPSPNHKRAIFFPPDQDKPRMIWMKVTNRDDFGYKYTLPDYDWIGGDTLLSAPGSRNIEENKIRGRRLGRGFAAWAEENDGYCVTLLYRDNYLNDGSIPNRSIAASVKPSGSPFRSYCGPMTAYRMVPRETIEDITLGDFRHLIDHLLVYGKETTH